MRKKITLITVITALLLALLMLCGCVSPLNPSNGGTPADDSATELPEESEAPVETEAPEETEAPVETEAPAETELPEETEAPEETKAPEVTEAPAATEAPEEGGDDEGSLTFEAVTFDEDFFCDMNGDGTDDLIHITTTSGRDCDYDFIVSITSGEGSAKAFECGDEITNSYEGYAIMIKDSEGGRLPALTVCVWQDSDDPTTFVYRVNAEDGSLKAYKSWASFPDPDMGTPIVHGLLSLSWRTEIMGTFDVTGYFDVGEDRFIQVSKEFQYPVNINYITVLKELPVTVVDEVTGETFETTVAPTTWVMPTATDRQTYAYVLLSSGEYAYVYYDTNEYPYSIKGVPQEEYLDVLYCD